MKDGIRIGITLCISHHIEFHSQYGNGDNTPEQFFEFIVNKSNELKSLAETIKLRLN